MPLSIDQERAISNIMSFLEGPGTEHILTGGPGVGKTFTVKYLIDQITERSNGRVHIYLTATTNKAASVLGKMTGTNAQTVHKLLNLRVKENYRTGKTNIIRGKKRLNLICRSLWILDESSMINEELHRIVLEYADQFQSKILYVGDQYQLPPVFSSIGSVFKYVTDISELNTIHRQGEHSSILIEAAKYREIIKCVEQPKFPEIQSTKDITKLNIDDFHNKMQDIFKTDEYKADIDHAKVLAWTNKKVNHYSKFVRQMFYDTSEPIVGEHLIVNNCSNNDIPLKTEDTVLIQDVDVGELYGIRGNWVVVDNGEDTCRVFLANDRTEVNDALKELANDAKKPEHNWREYFDFKKEFIDMRPVYASTIHKSQGGSMDIIFLDLTDVGRNTKWNEVARLIYVALTRARHHVYITGEIPSRLIEGIPYVE